MRRLVRLLELVLQVRLTLEQTLEQNEELRVDVVHAIMDRDAGTVVRIQAASSTIEASMRSTYAAGMSRPSPLVCPTMATHTNSWACPGSDAQKISFALPTKNAAGAPLARHTGTCLPSKRSARVSRLEIDIDSS